MTASKFTERLKLLMVSHGFTAKELGKKTGINYRTIEIWMSAKASIPRSDRAVLLAKALGVSVEYLISGEESKDILGAQLNANPKALKLAKLALRLPEDRVDDLLVMARRWENEEGRAEDTG
ncbi:helix-turn-helix domain-containing protein [Sediminispirochaeta smaragdinae]|nr:helix-turn-helix transcriptional regulator [Sediminispirochaeta smaragdinae]